MCGIIGFVGNEPAAPILLDGLERMEYRGYDSAGVAVRSETAGLQVRKTKGRLQVLSDLIHGGADLVGHLAHDGALLGGEAAHLLEDGGQFTLFAQVLDPQGVQFCGRSGLRKRGQSLRADGC